jgi:hypothetical protein
MYIHSHVLFKDSSKNCQSSKNFDHYVNITGVHSSHLASIPYCALRLWYMCLVLSIAPWTMKNNIR